MDTQEQCTRQVIRRSIISITVPITSKEMHLTFDKKLPFNTSKVVGVLTTVVTFSKPKIPTCEDVEGYYFEGEGCENTYYE